MELRYGKPEEVGMSTAGVERVEQAVQRLIDNGNTPSVVELIARDGIIVSHKAFGTNGMEEGAEPLALDAVFPVCSITKTFTAVCVMMLVEEGLIGLNRPVWEYLPEFGAGEKKEICIHNLLTHTSGIDDEKLNEFIQRNKDIINIPPNWQGSYDKEKVYYASIAPLAAKAGTVMSYCGTGFSILSLIMEQVTGISYAQFVEERLFKPLGMKDSCFVPSDEIRARLVKRKAPAIFDEWLNSEDCINNTSPAGGALTTVMDTAIFCSMLQNMGTYNGVRILSPVSVKEMTRNHIPGIASEYRGEFFPEAYWGLGFGINGTKKDGGDLFSPMAYSHWGAAGVFFCVDPEYRTIQIYYSVEVDHHRPFLDIYADSFNNAALAAITELNE